MRRLLLAISVLVLFAGQAWGAIAHVQSTGNSADGSASSIAQAFASNVTAGNLIVVTGYFGNTATCADSLGNTYQSGATNGRLRMFYAENISGGACTVTVSHDAATYRRISIHEYSGAKTSASMDTSAQSGLVDPGSSATNGNTTPAVTPSANGSLIVGCIVNIPGGWTTVNPGTNYTERYDNALDFEAEDYIQTTAASVSATWTCNNTEAYRAAMTVFLADQGGATTGVKAPTVAETVGEAPWNDANCTWVNPNNIFGVGEAEVTHSSFDTPDQTYVLKAYTFDFSAIPGGSTIQGVRVIINARYAVAAVSLDLMQLLDISRAKVGTNKYATPQALTTSAANYTIGGAADTWGNSLTAAWVKDPDFGVAIGAVANGANSDVFVDSVTMEVWYTPPATAINAVLGVTKASVKTADGLAIGSVKSINGLQ